MNHELINVYDKASSLRQLVIRSPFRPAGILFLLVKKGWVRVEFNNDESYVRERCAFTISSLSLYDFKDYDPDSEFYLIRVSPDFDMMRSSQLMRLRMNRYTHSLLALQRIFAVPEMEFDLLWEMCDALYRVHYLQGINVLQNESVHHQLFAVIFMLADLSNRYSDISFKHLTGAEKLMLNFMNLLMSHFKEERNLHFYGRELSVTAKHLSECLKEVTGYSGKELIQQTLLTEAKILLSSTQSRISQVAKDLHFSDQYAFSKFFKRLTGLSPTEFRSQE